MLTLLEKTRKINKLLQRSENIQYDSVARVLSNIINANVYVTDTHGKIYGYAFVDDFECDMMVDKVINQGSFPKKYVEWLLKLDETASNRQTKKGVCAFTDGATDCIFKDKNTSIVPIYGVGERIGTLILSKFGESFEDEDLLLAEYGATVIGMEMLRDRSQKIEIDSRKKATVQIALATLSYSEVDAAFNILGALKGQEGRLVASKIADEAEITRSVIVNALRKFESAGLIETKSLGMKGTYIKVLNEHLIGEVKKLRS